VTVASTSFAGTDRLHPKFRSGTSRARWRPTDHGAAPGPAHRRVVSHREDSNTEIDLPYSAGRVVHGDLGAEAVHRRRPLVEHALAVPLVHAVELLRLDRADPAAEPQPAGGFLGVEVLLPAVQDQLDAEVGPSLLS
jgi:hypothetical protein